jgi:hypothetical protein
MQLVELRLCYFETFSLMVLRINETRIYALLLTSGFKDKSDANFMHD